MNNDRGALAATLPPGPTRRRGDASMSVRVLIADDDAVFRQSLAQRLAAASNIDVVATARGGAEAVELYRELTPDVVLMDVVMPGGDGIEATARILALDADARVVALTGDDDYRALGLCLRAGARGAMRKNADAATITLLMIALAMPRPGRPDLAGPAERPHTWRRLPWRGFGLIADKRGRKRRAHQSAVGRPHWFSPQWRCRPRRVAEAPFRGTVTCPDRARLNRG